METKFRICKLNPKKGGFRRYTIKSGMATKNEAIEAKKEYLSKHPNSIKVHIEEYKRPTKKECEK